ncbi:MAG: hypothetical protein AB7F96_04190 [Beijerinckiaceae bacterium]
MFVREGVIAKLFCRKETTTGTSPRTGITSSHDSYHYELLIEGDQIIMEMDERFDALQRGQRTIVAGFRSRGKMQGYAFKNLVSGQRGASGGGLIGAFFGALLAAGTAGLVYLAIVSPMTTSDWILFVVVGAILLNLTNYIGGTVIRAWIAARAIDLYEARRPTRCGMQ